MHRHSRILLLSVTCLALACGAMATEPLNLSSQQVSEALARAIAQGTRSRALELVGPVLEDEAGSEYRFGYEARWNAANAVRDFRLVEEVYLLRKVASLPDSAANPTGDKSEDSLRNLLKILAVKSALSGLTLLGDSEAVALNRLQVLSPVISSTAIRNLKELKDWEATERIRSVLTNRALTPEAFLDLDAALDFLVASPMSEPRDCALLQRLTVGYRSCFDAELRPPGIAGCEDFVQTAKAFEARFQCPAVETPRK